MELAAGMPLSYRILTKDGQGEYEEKKSRFICTLRSVSTEEEAVSFIEEMKKKYWDARHNCSAFVLGNKGQLTRCNDDGEPSGTAGRPMLEVLLGEEVCNVCAVVTRYFGGTLLGTGGLVKAYTQAVKEALANSDIGNMCYCLNFDIATDYNSVGKIQYILGKSGLPTNNADYDTSVTFHVAVPVAQADALKKEITEATNGSAKMTDKELCYIVL